MSWNLFDPAGALVGALVALAILVLVHSYPDPDSDERIFIRFSLMGLYVGSFLVISSLWTWLVIFSIFAMFLSGLLMIWHGIQFRWPGVLPEETRSFLRCMWLEYRWLILGAALALLFQSLFAAGRSSGLGFHISAAVMAFILLSAVVARRMLVSVFFSFPGLVIGLLALAVGPSMIGLPIAYFLTRICQGDRRAAAVILLPVLLVGVIYA